MRKEKIVVALGGNALGNDPAEQLQLVQQTASVVADLAAEGYRIIVTHGNGPQVGMIYSGMEYSAKHGGGTPGIPLAECGAMSQGYIGYQLQQAIGNELSLSGIPGKCVTIVTQVVVAKDDPAFGDPTKPVGPFYTEEEAVSIMERTGETYSEDAGRGWRKVVPSSEPVRIEELDIIKLLADSGNIVIAAGGGGIPVTEDENGLHGVSAVIDKDRASARLAADLGAEKLIILTAVDEVYINFGTPDQKPIKEISASEARELIAKKQFPAGSMLPKVEACIEFVEKTGRTALITSPAKAKDGLAGKAGTTISW